MLILRCSMLNTNKYETVDATVQHFNPVFDFINKK